MGSMDTTYGLTKRKQGQRLVNAERDVLVAKLIDYLCQGYDTTLGLAKLLGCDRSTVDSMRPAAMALIGKMQLDRNALRNLQVRRVYMLVEGLIKDLATCDTVKEKSLVHSAIAKHHQHLALILGLNTEVQVHTGAQQLVIIRSEKQDGKNTTVVDGDVTTTIRGDVAQ